MKGIENLGKILGLVIALFYFLFFQGNETYEYVFFVLVLVTVGIPHGAVDHLLVSPHLTKSKLISFLLKYIGIIAIYLIAWFFLPQISLIAFLIMSAYHFGQSHFIQSEIQKLKKTTYMLVGGFYLSIILWSDFSYTQKLLSSLINIENLESYGPGLIFFTFILSNILTAYNQPSRASFHILESVVLGFVLYHLPLLLGFIIYFGFWHALPSMNEEYRSLKKFLGENKRLNFLKKLMPFTALSLRRNVDTFNAFLPIHDGK
jgi:Brp/Blh family beta-carotene 15,15'-monooxygenase